MTGNKQQRSGGAPAQQPAQSTDVETKPFPVVGLGASAGGVEALSTFFAHLPPTSGMAFVVILHLPIESESHIAAVVQRQSSMPVQLVSDSTPLEPNQVYVVPPHQHFVIVNGTLQRAEREPTDGTHLPIDHFFRALADALGGYAAGIVLSGTGSDGTLGIKRIKEAGGVTLAQDPHDAAHDGMPRSAIGTGCVDFVRPVAELPAALISYWQRAALLAAPPADEARALEDAEVLREIFAMLRVRTGHDFSRYKRPTIQRRLSRRMQVTGVAGLAAYLAFLRNNPEEIHALLNDLLISVTNFFRDRDAWAVLQTVVPQLFEGKGPNDQVRVWVVACATGEEAYSVAILLREFADTLDHPPAMQVFATDIDDEAIAVARQGLYPSTIAGDVSPARLQRFFIQDQGGYRVKQDLRDLVLFARHNVLHDPPFSRVDLITCRNLLIYLNREAQEYVLQTFYFSLRPGGYLLLGSSESVDGTHNLFIVTDKTHRMFQRRAGQPVNVPPLTPPAIAPAMRPMFAPTDRERVTPAASFGELHQQLVTAYTPPSVIVNEDGEVVHLGRGVGQYLHFGEGEPSHNLLKVVLPDLRLDLRAAFFTAQHEGRIADARHVPARIAGTMRLIDIFVQPLNEPEWARGHLLVVFQDVGEATAATISPSLSADAMVTQLEAELERTKFQLRATIEQYEAAVEEYKAANEELQAINEELRAASEELETSKEELQSINEELATVNQELRHKIDEVSRVNNDLQNLIASTQIGTIFLDRELRLKRYTPSIAQIFNVIPADLNRPIAHVTHKLQYERLAQDATEVLQTLAAITREVSSQDGRWFLLRILPYRTLEDRIDGVVLTFVDITERKHTEEALRANEQRLQRMMNVPRVGVLTFDEAGILLSANDAFLNLVGYARDEFEAKTLTWRDFTPPEYMDESFRILQQVRETGRGGPYEKEYFRRDSSRIWLMFVAAELGDGSIVEYVIDITERKRAEEALRVSEEKYRTLFNSIDEGFCTIEVLFDDTGYPYDYRFLETNPAFERQTGLVNIVGKTARECVPQLEQFWFEIYGRIATTGEAIRFEHEVAALGRFYDVYAFRIGAPAEHRVAVIFNDILARKQAEAALRASEQRFRAVADLVPDLLWSNDARGWMDWFNQRWFEYTGQSMDDARGDGWLNALHPDDRETAWQTFQAAIESGTPLRHEHRIRRDDGEYRWFLVQAQPVRDETGAIVRWYGAATDIHEERMALAEVEAALATRNQFLSIASHELRTPLTALLGYAHILPRALAEGRGDPTKMIEMIKRQTQRLNNLISQLLDVSRLQQGQFSIERQPLDVVMLVTRVVDDVRATLPPQSAHVIDLTHPTEPVMIMGDPQRLEQVFQNLLTNAVKYSPQGGNIGVHIRSTPTEVILEVMDEGIGIPTESLARLFEPFYRANNVGSQASGFGLGLHIVREIVRRHGGEVEAISTEGVGTTFRIRLPR